MRKKSAGRPTTPFVLTDLARDELTRLAKRGRVNRILAFRARTVLGCVEGTNSEVAAKGRTSNQTVGKWRKHFVEQRLDGLYDEPRVGAPRTISDDLDTHDQRNEKNAPEIQKLHVELCPRAPCIVQVKQPRATYENVKLCAKARGFMLIVFIALLAASSAFWAARIQSEMERGRRFAAFPVLFLGQWTAVTWVFGATGALKAGPLLVSAALLAGVALRLGRPPDSSSVQLNPMFAIMVIGLLAWFIARGHILPTCNSDALYLHLPRAVTIAKAHSLWWMSPVEPEWLYHAAFPMNYEAALASMIVLDGNDRHTELFSTIQLVLLALVVVAVGIDRGQRASTAPAVILVLLAAPVVLLHAASDKVDLAVAVSMACAVFWLAIRLREPENDHARWLAWAAAFLSVGYKRTGLALIVFGAVGSFVAIFNARERRSRVLAQEVISFGVCAFALGGVGLVANLYWTGRLFGGLSTALDIVSSRPPVSLSQWLEFPALMNLVPFSSNTLSVWVPWRDENWYWPKYNLFFSHWGVVLNALLPVAIVRFFFLAAQFARDVACRRGEVHTETPLAFLLASVVFLLITAKSYSYEGGFNSFPRFTLFYAVFVTAFILWPLFDRVAVTPRSTAVVVALSGLLCLATAASTITRDVYAPLEYVRRIASEEWPSRAVHTGPNRAPLVLDRIAPPDAIVGIDLSPHTWIHPLYGEDLRRDVRIIPYRNNTFILDDDLDFVVIDNIHTMVWNNAVHVKTAGDQLKAFQQGEPTARETQLCRQLEDDPRFEPIHVSPRLNECVFRRR